MTDWFEKSCLGMLPAQAAARWGEREALCFQGRRWSFAEVSAEVDRAAKGLLTLGIAQGEHVALWMVNCPEWIFAMFALSKIGAVWVPINSRLRTADVTYILRQSNSCGLIVMERSGPIDYLAMVRELVPWPPTDGATTSPQLPDLRHVVMLGAEAREGTLPWETMLSQGESISDARLEERAGSVDPDGLLYIMYTSGTTGFPKGAMHTHNVIRNAVDQANRLTLTTRDVILTNMPLFHVLAFFEGPLMSMLSGFRQVLTESFDPEESLDMIERERVSAIFGFDFNYKALLDAQERRPRDVSSLRIGVLGAGMASSTEVAYRAQEVFVPTVSGYGMTEIGIGAALGSATDTPQQRCETTGFPLPGYEFRVVDPANGQSLPPDTPGEIQVRGYMVTQGYYKKPEETKKTFTSDGWLKTGDLGILRSDGYVRLLGRYKDIIKIGGENVDPLEVENFLLEHPAIDQVAVVSLPHPKLSEVGVAFVVLQPGQTLTLQEVESFCRGRIASFKIPRHVVQVDELPLTASGKVQKFKLREQVLEILPTPEAG